MRYIRLTEPTDAAKLLPWFAPTGEQDRMAIACSLAERLAEAPERVFCLVAVQDRIAHAFLTAYLSERYKHTVWLWQARVDRGFDKAYPMWEQLVEWAKINKCKAIRMAPTNERMKRFYERRYGFRHKGKEMIYHVDG